MPVTDASAQRSALAYATQHKQLLIGGKWTDAHGQATTEPRTRPPAGR